MDKKANEKNPRETVGDPENQEALAHSAELINYGGIIAYMPWDI